MAKQYFSIGQVLTVVGDKMLVGDVGDLYKILDFLTNSQLWTHQLPDAAKKARPWILSQCPQFVGYDDSTVNRDNWRTWLADCRKKYGESIELEQMPPDDQLQTDPMRDIPDGIEVIPVIIDREPTP